MRETAAFANTPEKHRYARITPENRINGKPGHTKNDSLNRVSKIRSGQQAG
jgi:hypothetical protein